MDYLKYYWLEKDFFPEIYKFFRGEKYLTMEHFFSIIIWKRNASKTIIKRGLLATKKSLNEVVKDLTEKIYYAETKEQKLEILLKQSGFQLAMASAVLTVLYPDIFTVYDWRVREQIKYPDITYQQNRVQRYFDEYIKQVLERGREIAENPKLSLRDCDRLLWARSWHKDLREFLIN